MRFGSVRRGLAMAGVAAVATITVGSGQIAGARSSDVTLEDLSTAEVPAYCEMPRQRVVAGESNGEHHAQGAIVTVGDSFMEGQEGPPLVASGDFAHLGYRQMLTVYWCTAGGVGWPNMLILVGSGGKLLGSAELDTHGSEHAVVDSMRGLGRIAKIAWYTENNEVHYQGTVSFTKGKLRVVSA